MDPHSEGGVGHHLHVAGVLTLVANTVGLEGYVALDGLYHAKVKGVPKPMVHLDFCLVEPSEAPCCLQVILDATRMALYLRVPSTVPIS